ncbi:repressor [Marichromatium purpuratum 984]|uniref:Repressor n=1 Tax=Marichromatium purpuratum 984 TaxID=765910 RepID=W0E2H3_MARPU|nr:helix-turn-helix transcriptional regulator [Marichromatium purpuratum]AHF03429.1 repressor [Marichromatium purpuratum 984]
MYTATSPGTAIPWSVAPTRPVAAVLVVAASLTGVSPFVSGTGGALDISRAVAWCRLGETRTSISSVDVEVDGEEEASCPDVRSPLDHLTNIRETLNPAIADLAGAFAVSRQSIYKWLKGESMPEAGNLERIQALSQVADAFREADIKRAPAMLKMKAFEGRSLLDLVATNEATLEHARSLISEAKAMDASYERSGLARSKAKPSEDWRSSHSIPGAVER